MPIGESVSILLPKICLYYISEVRSGSLYKRGANRGIGLGFVKALLERENVIIFAGARDPGRATELRALAQVHPRKLHVVKLVAVDEAGNKATIEEIKVKAGRLDVVIANAGIATYFGTALDSPAQEWRDHYQINVIGTLVLFQASYPLLRASTSTPKFIIISSRGGSITTGPQWPGLSPYGASKAAVNFLARKLHFENENLVVLPICPGPVDTDMVSGVKSHLDFFDNVQIPTVTQSVSGMLPIIDDARRLVEGPVFRVVEGGVAPW